MTPRVPLRQTHPKTAQRPVLQSSCLVVEAIQRLHPQNGRSARFSVPAADHGPGTHLWAFALPNHKEDISRKCSSVMGRHANWLKPEEVQASHVIVAIPARNEAGRIERCLSALGVQRTCSGRPIARASSKSCCLLIIAQMRRRRPHGASQPSFRSR